MRRVRSSTAKLPRTDPSWTAPRQSWVRHLGAPTKILHRPTLIAAPDGSAKNHAITVCDNYLSRAALYFTPPDDIDLCDACLMGDTVYHVVYVVRSTDNLCQYVGYSADLVQRIGKHQRESPWWDSSLTIIYTVYDNEIAARRAESAAILRLKPVHNRTHTGGGPRTNSRKATLHVCVPALLDLIARDLDTPAAGISNAIAADFLGVDVSTVYRLRNDPEYVVSSSFVAQVMTVFGGIPAGLFEARPARLSIAA